MYDSHAHLNFSDFSDNYKEIIQKCFERNISVINVGATFVGSERSLEIANEYDKGVYSVVGVHPLHAEEGSEGIEDLAKESKVVAIGEIGLDKEKKKTFKIQKKEFEKQLEIATEMNLPVVVHSRKAHKEVISILSKYSVKGAIHCFTGNMADLKKYLDLGFYVGYNGIIFKLSLDKQIKKTPMDRLILETDCPYLSPPEWSGRNNPLGVLRVAEKIADIKMVSLEELEEETDENVKNLFNI